MQNTFAYSIQVYFTNQQQKEDQNSTKEINRSAIFKMGTVYCVQKI